MISKVLLTLGDDEFFASVDDSMAMNGGGGGRMNGGWLSRDEILSISGLLRNVAFAMYWYEGKAPLVNLDSDSLGDDRLQQRTPRVPGMRMTLLSLRALVTTLLKQLHSRDSRRRFAPAITGSWWVSSISTTLCAPLCWRNSSSAPSSRMSHNSLTVLSIAPKRQPAMRIAKQWTLILQIQQVPKTVHQIMARTLTMTKMSVRHNSLWLDFSNFALKEASAAVISPL